MQKIWSAPAPLTNSLCTFFALLLYVLYSRERGKATTSTDPALYSSVFINHKHCDQSADKCDYSAEQADQPGA